MVRREAARGREGYRVEIQFYFVSLSSRMWSTDYESAAAVYVLLCLFFSSSLCRWFLNSDCFYDAAMLKESKPLSQPSASVVCRHLTQGTAESFSTVRKNTAGEPWYKCGCCCGNSDFYLSGLTNLIIIINNFLLPFLAKSCKSNVVSVWCENMP